MPISLRQWSKGSARGAGPQVQRGVVHINYDARAADIAMCAHGIAMRRCDDCGVYVASHPGAVAHVCRERRASCADGAVTR
jgi:hypothetical protein